MAQAESLTTKGTAVPFFASVTLQLASRSTAVGPPGPRPFAHTAASQFVLLDTDFDQGRGFLEIWAAWRRAPQSWPRLHVVAVAPATCSAAELREVHADAPNRDLALELARAWPPSTPNIRPLVFDGGRVHLLLAPGEPTAMLRQLRMRADTIWLRGASAPAGARCRHLVKSLARLAAPGAPLLWVDGSSAATVEPDAVSSALRTAGFIVEHGDVLAPIHLPRQPERASPAQTATLVQPADVSAAATGVVGATRMRVAHHTPRPSPRMASIVDTGNADRRAVIVGAGLAGAATAWALAERGWRTTVIDRQPFPAAETSGNPAGLFHGIVNPQDGRHARFNRAAALQAQALIERAVASGEVKGSVDGLLRLQATGVNAEAMRATLLALGLPAGYVRAVDAEQASALAGIPLTQACWHYPTGGWVNPGELTAWWLRQAESDFRGKTEVHAVQPDDRGWTLLDADGRSIDHAAVVVLANAHDALRLLADASDSRSWPVHRVRGQISQVRAKASSRRLPRVPIAGAGYLLPDVDGWAVFGATSQPGDEDPAVRSSDHAENLAQLARLLGSAAYPKDAPWQGRTGWRVSAHDRLPIAGAAPDARMASSATASLDQPRRVPRLPGLFVHTALGSRGIAWSVLGGRIVASAIAGTPAPAEADLLDAVDPARFLARSVRRSAAGR